MGGGGGGGGGGVENKKGSLVSLQPAKNLGPQYSKPSYT